MKIKNVFNVKLKDVEMEGAEGCKIRWLIHQKDGANNFAMRLFEIAPGGHSPLHTHNFEHEVYILEGEGILFYEGQEYKFKKDYFIFVEPNKEHQFKNTGKNTLKFLCLIPIK